MVAVPLGEAEAKLITACKKWPDADRDRVKAELCVACHDDNVREALVVRLHALEIVRIDGLGPKLPAHRREVLEAAAAEAADGWRCTLATMRVELDKHRTGRHLLRAVACDVLATCEEHGSASPRRYSADESRVRGESHERLAVAWAKIHWPSPAYEVLRGCVVVAGSAGAGGQAHGVKGEFDAMIVRRSSVLATPGDDGTSSIADGNLSSMSSGACSGGGDEDVEDAAWLVAIVEAKAAHDCFHDVPKLVDARDRLMASGGAPFTVRHGAGSKRTAPTRRVRVQPTGPPPHIAYVFGARAASIDGVVERAAATTLRHLMLDKEVEDAASHGDAGEPFELLNARAAHGADVADGWSVGGAHSGGGDATSAPPGRLEVRATFGASRVVEQQHAVSSFHRLVCGLAARGEASFWVPND